MTNILPNFLIVGAAKSGTTSLYHYLNQHPEVFMPVNKEPNFFVSKYQLQTSQNCPSYKIDRRRMVFNENEYHKLFNDVKKEHIAIGEATVTYLYKPDYAIPNIKKYLGDPKIIIILRDPVKRAFSQYSYVCELGLEKDSFYNAISKEPVRLKNNWSSTFAYVNQGKFYSQVKSYKEAFSNVHIIFLEEFTNNKQKHLRELYRFLNIDESFKNSFDEEHNVSGVPRLKYFHKLLVHDNPLKTAIKKMLNPFIASDKLRTFARQARILNQGEKLKLSEKDEQYLIKEYSEDIFQLEQLLNRNLNLWKKPDDY
jgi:Sulfotransferase domain